MSVSEQLTKNKTTCSKKKKKMSIPILKTNKKIN